MKYTTSFICLLWLSANYCIAQAKTPIAVNVSTDSVTFVIIGDYGQGSKQEKQVAEMVKSWTFDFIITTGDNNYPLGSAKTLKKHISKYYGDYIYNPDAPEKFQCHGKAAQDKVNRFFPSPGNHDNNTDNLQPYIDFFTLPGDEHNYDFTYGPIHFYALNTGLHGDVPCCESPESKWLKSTLDQSKEPFKFVYFHHPPYSPGEHGSSLKMRWPYTAWGVDAVLCGHEHFYARVEDKVTPKPIYIICGSSGNNRLYGCNDHPLDATRFDVHCDNFHWGAMKVRVTKHTAIFDYYTIGDPSHPVDTYIIHK